MAVFKREQIPYKEGMSNLIARDRIFLPRQYEVVVSTADRARAPATAKRFDELFGIKSKFETAVWADRYKGKELRSPETIIVAEYPDKEIALVGHERIVDNVRHGRMDFKDIRTGESLFDPSIGTPRELERYKVAPRRRPVQVRGYRRRVR